VTIAQGAVPSIPFLGDVFKGLPGEEGGLVWAHRVALTYDTRDSRVTPIRGSFGEVFVEGAARTLGSQAAFVRYGLEGRLWWPLFDARLVTVTRGLCGWVEGAALPFFELSALGGDTTLRGFGDHRFLDMGHILLNIEERIRTFTFTYEDIHTTLDLAFFVEAGQVFHTWTELSTKNVQAVSGVGLRLVVTAKLVAKVDIGFGREGIAIFTGLDYPF
jgi:outer membrane protein assembly factor BamA